MMESINCPVLGCSYSTPANTDAAVVAALLNAHTTTHNSTNTAAKVEKVKRPTISTAGSSEEWAYFETRWDDYKTATRVTGHKGVFYLCIVDRYSNWSIIEKTTGGASGLIDSLRRTFVTYGIPDELASEGGSEFVSGDTQKFLKSWGVYIIVSLQWHSHTAIAELKLVSKL